MDSTLENFYYAALRQGNNHAIWRFPSGDAVSAGDYLLFKESTGIMYYDCGRGQFDFTVNIPDAPSAGDSRQWGLVGSGGSLLFDITGTVFSAKSSWQNGTYNDSVTLTWDTTWIGTDLFCTILWRAGQAIFYINNIPRGVINAQSIPAGSMSPYVVNAGTDNFLLKNISGKSLQSLVLEPQITASDNIPVGARTTQVSDSLTNSESVVPQLFNQPHPGESLALSEAVTTATTGGLSITDSATNADVITGIVRA